MDKAPDPWDTPSVSRPYRQRESFTQDSALFKAIFLITYIIAFLFFIVSVFGLFDPSWGANFNKPSDFYLFFLLINSPPIGVTTIWLNVGMTVLYATFFLTMLYFGIKRWNGPAMNNPIIFYGSMASFGLFMSLLIVIIEQAMGIPIGGTSIETGLKTQPYLSFVQLIFAPYAEEFGFRILPLGLLSVYYVAKARASGLDTAAAFVLPGIIRKKYGLRLTKWDYSLIIFTSILFGAAHYLLGAWDPGKIISAAFVGFILAFGFIKFGIFVDIPTHWFFNGFTTVDLIVPSVTGPYAMAIFWTIISGLIATVYLIIIAVERKGKYQEDALIQEQNPFS